MTSPVIIIGLGQLGAVFAHALLRVGHTVVPANRGDSLSDLAKEYPSPKLVLVTVGEADLPLVLSSMPSIWHDHVVLVQNELLPSSWRALNTPPTVAVVWFEKKRGKGINVICPTPVSGPRAHLIVNALTEFGIDAIAVESTDLVPALVLKNLYILTANIAGMLAPPNTNVGALWTAERAASEQIAREILEIQRKALGGDVGDLGESGTPDDDMLLTALGVCFMADPEHGAKGRSAPARLARAILAADDFGLAVPALRNAQKLTAR